MSDLRCSRLTMKNAVFWDMMPCDSCKNRRFGGTCRFRHQGDRSLLRLLVTANVVSSSSVVTLIVEAIPSSETSVLIRVTQRYMAEDGILQVVTKLVDANIRRDGRFWMYKRPATVAEGIPRLVQFSLRSDWLHPVTCSNADGSWPL
jgi:hypothetical protein